MFRQPAQGEPKASRIKPCPLHIELVRKECQVADVSSGKDLA